MKRPVHLVGSVAMDTCEEVFQRLSRTVGPYISRIPDGETGKRSRWIAFQREMLMEHPDIEIDPTVPELEIREWNGRLLRAMPLLRFKDGTDLASVRFETGYDRAALDSYGVFGTMRSNGRIPQGVRFQVCLPTPTSSAYMYMSHKAHRDFINVYERSLRTALENILDGIPHEDIAIQYDVCQEVLIFEDYFPHRPDDYKEQVFDLLGRLGDAVSEDVDLGYIHHDDEAGDAARMDAARKYLDDFGISTECGWGRTDPARVPGLLESHRRQARLISG